MSNDGQIKIIDSAVVETLNTRLRRSPSPYAAKGSLPVLFFGELFSAKVVTVGLNPSHQEYLDRERNELDGDRRRFETLASLGAVTRASMSDEQCMRAIQTMRGYYQPGKPIYSWFRSMNRVLEGMNFRYAAGQAANLDLVQEATDPAWSQLQKQAPGEAEALLAADLPFLYWQLATFPIDLIVCNGRTVFEHVRGLINGEIEQQGKLRRITWYAGTGNAGGRIVTLVGWNIPLARPTGLGIEGEHELGELLLKVRTS